MCVALSYAPVPEQLVPIPELKEKGFAQVAQGYLLPKRAAKAVPLEGEEPPPPEPESQPVEDDEPASASSPAQTGMHVVVEADRAAQLEQLMKAVGAKHVDITEPCIGGAVSACEHYALDPFFEALDALGSGERQQSVRIVHFGDSLIASDYISDLVRRRLQKRLGSGGAGFLYVDRPSRFGGLKTRAGDASSGWEITKLPEPPAPDGVYGFGGVSFTAARRAETSSFTLKGARRADVFYFAHERGGMVELLADNAPLWKIDTRGSREGKKQSVAIPAGTRTLSLSTKGNVRLFGVALDNDAGGVTLDSIGLPGAFGGAYLKAETTSFAATLAARDPQLLLVMLGGNEALRLDNNWANLDAIRSDLSSFIDRLRAATPDAACLVTSPLMSGVTTAAGETRVRKVTKPIADVFKAVAIERGCAYWDMLEAAGGADAILRWSEARLMNQDLVHPVRSGADLVGHMLDSALQRAYFVRHGPDALADPSGLIDVSGKAFVRVFKKLARLEKEKKGRVAIVQFGASHTAGHMFTDEARDVLQKRFGDAGRGYIAAGAPSARLKRAKITRALSKGWRVSDALRAPPGEYWGLTGIRADGQPNAHMEITFCDGCPSSKTPSVIQVHYLEEPGMGRIEVKLDGQRVAVLPEKPKRGAPPLDGPVARVFTMKAKGASHSIKLKNIGESEVTIFGVSEELDRSGLIYDALGLPGATAITADGFDKATLSSQLVERAADLYVFFYGTNESALQNFDATKYQEHFSSLLATLRSASPDADCLIMGPTDRMIKREDGTWQEVLALRSVIAAQRQVAEKEGCAFWSARAAMGGKDSMQTWIDAGRAHVDHVHLNEPGYAVLAQMVMKELLDAYGAYLVYAATPVSGLEDKTTTKKRGKKR
jgi:lysophospholipase L1-like esterase